MGQHLPVMLTVLPLAGAFLVFVAGRARGAAYRIALATVGLECAVAIAVLVQTGGTRSLSYFPGGWMAPWGIEIRIDPLIALMAVFFSFVYLAVFVYAGRMVPAELDRRVHHWYWSLLLLLLAGIMGVLGANDLFNLFVFLEVAALSACGVISVRERLDSMEAAIKYLMLSTVGAGCILFGIALLYMVTGHMNMGHLAAALPAAAGAYPRTVLAALALLTTGLALKSALFPLHVWLPDAYATGPSPTSALLAGLAGKIGIAALLRLFFGVFGAATLAVLPVNTMLLYLSVLGVIAGALLAIAQIDLKRLLAYSSVAQVAYIFLGLALLNRVALTGSLLELINHAVVKAMLFLIVGLIAWRTGGQGAGAMAGIARHMPLTAAAFTVGAASLIGVPLTGGFVSKWHLIKGAIDSGQTAFALVVLFGSLLSSVYLVPLLVSAYFGRSATEPPPGPEGPPALLWPVIGLAGLCLLLGIWPRLPLQVLAGVAANLLSP